MLNSKQREYLALVDTKLLASPSVGIKLVVKVSMILLTSMGARIELYGHGSDTTSSVSNSFNN
jgi:hypothetical protein